MGAPGPRGDGAVGGGGVGTYGFAPWQAARITPSSRFGTTARGHENLWTPLLGQ